MTTALETGDRRSPKGRILVAFVLGLALGLALAWRVWPIQWTDTDPSDLRAEHQREYVIMAADSWTVTGNANEARERLYQLVDDDTDWVAVDALVASAAQELEQAGSVAAALRVRRMHENVPLPIEPGAPTAAVEPEGAPGSPRWALVLIGLGLVVMTIALVIWLISSQMRKREALYDAEAQQTPVSDMYRPSPGRALALDPVPGPGGLGIHVAERSERETPRWDEAAFMEVELEEEDLDIEADDEWEDEPEEQPLTQRPALDVEEAWYIEADEAEPEQNARVVDLPDLDDDDLELVEDVELDAMAEEVAPPQKRAAAAAFRVKAEEAPLAVFEATYAFGDDDFYHAFSIESPKHEFLGQCGIVISDVLGIEGAQLVDAFDIWLFETRGTRTMSKVLASEHAYTDDDLGAKLARKGELVLAQEGLIVTLQTESLRLSATVVDYAYRQDQPEDHSVFDRLQVRMVVEQIS